MLTSQLVKHPPLAAGKQRCNSETAQRQNTTGTTQTCPSTAPGGQQGGTQHPSSCQGKSSRDLTVTHADSRSTSEEKGPVSAGTSSQVRTALPSSQQPVGQSHALLAASLLLHPVTPLQHEAHTCLQKFSAPNSLFAAPVLLPESPPLPAPLHRVPF